jgi:hypothetical protein
MAIGTGLRGVVAGALLLVGACAAEPPGECRRLDACCKAMVTVPTFGKLGAVSEVCVKPHNEATTDTCAKGMTNIKRDLKVATDGDKTLKPPTECTL